MYDQKCKKNEVYVLLVAIVIILVLLTIDTLLIVLTVDMLLLLLTVDVLLLLLTVDVLLLLLLLLKTPASHCSAALPPPSPYCEYCTPTASA